MVGDGKSLTPIARTRSRRLGTINVEIWRWKAASQHKNQSASHSSDDNYQEADDEDQESDNHDGDDSENGEASSEDEETTSESEEDESEDHGTAIVNVPEKALKGQAIHIGTRYTRPQLFISTERCTDRYSLGQAKPCEAPNLLDGSEMDKHPVAVFKFKYRTLGQFPSKTFRKASKTKICRGIEAVASCSTDTIS